MCTANTIYMHGVYNPRQLRGRSDLVWRYTFVQEVGNCRDRLAAALGRLGSCGEAVDVGENVPRMWAAEMC